MLRMCSFRLACYLLLAHLTFSGSVPLRADILDANPFGNMALYLCNFHSHTSYSDHVKLPQDARGVNPWLAGEDAARNGLDALATTDHSDCLSTHEAVAVQVMRAFRRVDTIQLKGLNVKEHDLDGCVVGVENMRHLCLISWNEATDKDGVTYAVVRTWSGDIGKDKFSTKNYVDGRLIGKWNHTLEITDLFNKTPPTSKSGRRFVLLHGFEWPAIYHMNVIGADQYIMTSSENLMEQVNYWREWVTAQEIVDPSFFCQINHPTLVNQYCEERNITYAAPDAPQPNMLDVISSRVSLQQLDPLVRHMALIEMTSHGRQEIIIPFTDRCGDGLDKEHSNEYWYREYLRKGWRIAPGNNEDNHFGLLKEYGGSEYRTGVWVGGAQTPDGLIAAVLDRRTFSTEYPAMSISLRAKVGNAVIPMGGAVALTAERAVTFQVDAPHPKSSMHREVVLVEIRRNRQDSITRGEKNDRIECTLHDDVICVYAKVGTYINEENWVVSAPIWFIQQGTNIPNPTPIFVIDRSGSITGAQGVMAQIQRDAEHFVDEVLRHAVQAAVINFSGQGACSLDADFTGDRATLLRAIQQPSILHGGTALNDAVVNAVAAARRKQQNPIIVLLSDGMENSSRNQLRDAIFAAKSGGQYGIPVITVGYVGTEGRNEDGLIQLADATGGFYEDSGRLDIERLLSRVTDYRKGKTEVRIKGRPE